MHAVKGTAPFQRSYALPPALPARLNFFEFIANKIFGALIFKNQNTQNHYELTCELN